MKTVDGKRGKGGKRGKRGSKRNLMAYCIGPTEEEQIADLVERIHLTREIGFSAHIDNVRNKVEILIYHHGREKAVHNDSEEFVYYGYGLPKRARYHYHEESDY